MAEVYVIDPITDDFQQMRCPLSRCPKTFLCPKQMLRHLKVCKYFDEGSFKCPICNEMEEFPTVSCRKGRWDRTTLKQRLGNSVESLYSYLPWSNQGSVPQGSLPRCGGCNCSHPSGMRPSLASIGKTLTVIEKSARANSIIAPNYYGFINSNPTIEMGGTIVSELEGPKLALELEGTGSCAYKPSNFISELPTEFLPAELSAPLTSQYKPPSTSIFPTSSGNSTSQNHTGLGTDASSHENQQMGFQKLHGLVAQDLLRQPEARFNKPDDVSVLYPFQFKDIDQSPTISSVFRHTSVHEERSSLPIDSCYQLDCLSSSSVSGPQSQDAVYLAAKVLSPFNPTIATVLDTPQQHINIDTAPFGGSLSSMDSLALIYGTSPSSKPNTSFADSDALSPDQADDQTAVMKCDQCEFVPTGNKKMNLKAYLRRHRRTHDERR